MTPAEFDVRLMHCLDARRDPFLDPDLEQHLLTDPAAAVRVADLLARLEVVERLTPPTARAESGARPSAGRAQLLRRACLAALAAVLLAVVAVAFAASTSHRTEARAPGRVLRARLSTIDERPNTATVTVRTVLAREHGLSLQTFDRRVVRR